MPANYDNKINLPEETPDNAESKFPRRPASDTLRVYAPAEMMRKARGKFRPNDDFNAVYGPAEWFEAKETSTPENNEEIDDDSAFRVVYGPATMPISKKLSTSEKTVADKDNTPENEK